MGVWYLAPEVETLLIDHEFEASEMFTEIGKNLSIIQTFSI
jgi:hypothetical protein